MLGFSNYVCSYFDGPDHGVETIWMGDPFCFGDEEKLENCDFYGWGTDYCGHDSDIGLICHDSKPWIIITYNCVAL